MKNTIVLSTKIIVEKGLANEMEQILEIEEGHYEGAGRDSVIRTFSTSVSHEDIHFGVDIKVCNGDTPYVDPVLFSIENANEKNEAWSEIYPLDVEDELLGDYQFETEEGDTNFVINVSVIPSDRATAEDIEKYGIHD